LRIKPGGKVLEIGPGNGRNAIEAAKLLGPEGSLTVLEIESEYIEKLERTFKEEKAENIIVAPGNAYSLPFGNEIFDQIFFVCYVNEIPDLFKAIRECFRVLKFGGTLAFSE